jgi:hypothetical protein
MKAIKALLIGLVVGILSLAVACPVAATPSGDFVTVKGETFDDWGVCRTRAQGENGFFQMEDQGTFRPVIAFESLGGDAHKAYELGKELADKYPDLHQRAERIFYFVRDSVQYTPDIDQFQFEEFAQNADELAETIAQRGIGQGDCEDMAILLAVMYKGAGCRSAIVLAPGHAAALVHLPDYRKANLLELGGEPGWVWCEATGKNNQFGWIPSRYNGARLAAYEVLESEQIEAESPSESAKESEVKTGRNIPLLASPFISVIGLMWIMTLFRRRRR